MKTNGEGGGSSLLPVAAMGEASKTRWCEVVSVLVVALAKVLVVVPVLGMQMVLRFNHVRWLLQTVLFVMRCNGIDGLGGT
jgi:nitrate reductase NapE component